MQACHPPQLPQEDGANVGGQGVKGFGVIQLLLGPKKAELTLFPRDKKVLLACSLPASKSLPILASQRAGPRPGMLAMQKGDRTGSRAPPGLWPHWASLSLLSFLHKMKLKCPPPAKEEKNLKRGI